MLKRVFSVLVSIPLCLAQGSIFASREIDVSSSRPIQAPPFSYFGESQCDRDGNMYFHAVDSDFRQGQIFRLSSDGTSGKFFRITGKFADPDSAAFDSFWVTNDGEVFLLASNAEEKYVFTFDHNGVVKAPAVLKVREDVQLTDFAVFDNGFLFVWGFHAQKSPSDLRGKPYAAVLTESGELVREVSIAMPTVDLGNLGAPSDGAAASYAGNLYFLGSDQITVISATGETIRRLKFHKPDPQAIATRLYLSAGMAVIAVNKISTKGSTRGEVHRSFIALDQDSGDLIGYYEPSARLGSNDVCFSRADGLTFLQSDGKTQKLATALLR
jgi:outer membrane protein assembly factor BamB